MKILLPKQHGAWAMLLIPFLLGVVKGGAVFAHIPLFLGWLSLYLFTYPILMISKKKKVLFYRKWAIIYGLSAILSLIYPLFVEWRLVYFGMVMLPFFMINIYFARRNKERAFINDLTAIITFGIGGAASYFLASGMLDRTGWLLFVYTFLFFLGSTFYVKSMIREKNNPLFKKYSWVYHILLFIITAAINLWVGIAYLPSLVRSIVFYGKKPTVMKVGVLEIVNSLFFFFIMSVYKSF